MEITNKEIVLLLSGNEYLNKQTIAHSKSLRAPVNVQDHLEEGVTSTLYSLVLENCNMEPKHLLDRSDATYQKELRGQDMTKDEWVRFLKMRPDLLRAPIAIRGDQVVVCDNPSKVQSLDRKARPRQPDTEGT